MDRETFDEMTTHVAFYTGRKWDGSLDHLLAANARQAEAVEILNAHADWLDRCKERVEQTGEPWNTRTCRDQSRRDGDLAAPPQWIGNYSENCTPPWMLNR